MYVGYSVDLNERRTAHFAELRKNIHGNQKLQNSWNKYGEGNFLYEILIECEEEYLRSEENYWCNLLNVHDRRYGYNIEPTSPIGTIRLSEETKKKIGDKSRGKVVSKATRDKLRQANLGKKQSKETIEKRLKTMEGRWGHPISEEHKEKLRKVHLGRKHTPEQIEKRISKTRGRKCSEETKRKMSESAKIREAKKKQSNNLNIKL